MLPDRSDSSAVNSAKVMSKFLTEMQVFVIGCTNYPEKMDVALRRSFQRFIHVILPDSKSQSQMMQKWYKELNHTIPTAEFD